MSEIIGVRFKEGGKIYYFSPNDEVLEPGCYVVVETVRGTECGEVVMGRRELEDGEFNRELKTIIRKANPADLNRLNENKIKAKKAFEICNQKIKAHGLDMNLLEVECTFDNSKIVFNFSAEGRVDFRELVKDLASVFRSRIELRQIGVRDEAKMLGGLGVCGRPFCCKQFMGDFQSVSIKMAKEQGLSLNPVKISGTCGRLMCCLKHEQDAYEDLMRTMPQVGSAVVTPEGPGVVVDRELIAGRVKVRLDGSSEAPPKTFRFVDIQRAGHTPVQPQKAEEHTEAPHIGSQSNREYPKADFEESISSMGRIESPDQFEEDIRPSRRPKNEQSNSRRHGRQPDRRNYSRKGTNSGKQQNHQEKSRDDAADKREVSAVNDHQGEKGGHPKEGGKAGNAKPRHNRNRQNYNRKKGGGTPTDRKPSQSEQ